MLVGKDPLEDVCSFSPFAFKSKNENTLAIGSQHTGSKNGLSIASLNITALRSHLDEIQLLLCEINTDILVLNETKLMLAIQNSLQQFQLMNKINRKGVLEVAGFLFISEIP